MKKIILLICLIFLFFMADPYWQNLLKSYTDSEKIEAAILRLIAASGGASGAGTWAGLNRTSNDTETIEQAIARLIAVHEADATSHLGVGESLQSHKSADVIDHPAYSVVRDKTKFDRRQLDFYFTSLSGVNVTSQVSIDRLGELTMVAGASPYNNQALEILNGDSGFYSTIMTKYPVFQIDMLLSQITNQTIYIINGSNSDWSGYGFKISGANLYGVYFDNSFVEHTTLLMTLSASVVYILRAEYNSDSKIYWFVDSVQKGSVSSPQITDPQAFFAIYFSRLVSGTKYAYFSNFHWDADY